ncbi:TetR/AcrR family transcriptional regulator [Zavarzinia compransoris]|uniref:TetR/AcrR family transcriptional regulator n=1 Tax=Zavarzinia marina TaxID=2911065 RepID=UPI001F3BA1E8|nr:TetR/AcrR family transcriptional regulator [Zavarzinia marina]MCF4165720.1 TetR/AcrR family transcriptional regulator [Zavarzinia marina]
MGMGDAAGTETRQESRRRQILDAAIRCFRNNGFHATSMAALAKEAGMSVGHIYHYFENKEAIIAAFIEEKFEDFRTYVETLKQHQGSIADAMIEQVEAGYDGMSDPDKAGLFLEITVEASRNPKVAAMVQEADHTMRTTLAGMIAESCGCTEPDTEDRLMARVDMIVTLYEGLTIRAIRNPGINRDSAIEAMRLAFDRLLSP